VHEVHACLLYRLWRLHSRHSTLVPRLRVQTVNQWLTIYWLICWHAVYWQLTFLTATSNVTYNMLCIGSLPSWLPNIMCDIRHAVFWQLAFLTAKYNVTYDLENFFTGREGIETYLFAEKEGNETYIFYRGCSVLIWCDDYLLATIFYVDLFVKRIYVYCCLKPVCSLSAYILSRVVSEVN